MSSNDLIISSDEEESYNDRKKSEIVSDGELVIDEIESEDDSNISEDILHTRRESDIFLTKKKPVRVLSSDSEAEDVDREKTNKLDKLSISSEQSESAASYVSSKSSKDEANHSLTKKGNVSTTETKNRSKSQSFQGARASFVHTNISDHESNLSRNVVKGRITEEFRFNAAGILNSTALPSRIPEKTDLSQIRELHQTSSDIIEVISDDDDDDGSSAGLINLPKDRKTVQQTLESFIVKQDPSPDHNHQTTSDSVIINDVTPTEYQIQKNKVSSLATDLSKMENMLRTINMSALPDGGLLLRQRFEFAKKKLLEARNELALMSATKEDDDIQPVLKQDIINISWEDLQDAANAVQPKTFGKKAMSTYNNQKAVTLDRLHQLHNALKTCPKEEDLAEDPKGLKVELMSHQKRALAWLKFREKEKPSGGILADDMGLGKTLTMLSLILSGVSQNSDDDSDDEEQFIGKNTTFKGGSLIVCPASLLNQWSGEIDRRIKRGLLSYLVYHGPKRETRAKILAQYNIIITTYSIISNEAVKNSPIFKTKWRRIILDEAHQIRNHKSKTFDGCCQLLAISRWALTGTPMHNKELDMYALLKYLRCSPFDDLQVWKRWVGDKSTGGVERLHTVISSLMLRRTKVELMEQGSLKTMPSKTWELIEVHLDNEEMHIYHKVLIFSQTLFAQFLHQRAEKNQDMVDQQYAGCSNSDPNAEYFKMRQKLLKLNKLKNVNQHEILVLLLRLRQICCHPYLITGMLENATDLGDDDEECEELNLLEQLNKLNIEDKHDDQYDPANSIQGTSNQDERVTLKEASKGHLNPSDPIFSQRRASSKIKAMLKVLQEKILGTSDKAIVVSQWSSFLDLVAIHLENHEIEFDQLNGKVPVHKRIGIVERFNDPDDKMRVLLLSLTAGGVGLNLVGGNHLFLLDLHWNPQLENQAQDRIYRVGQTKPVFVYKFITADTIEQRIKSLQERKLNMAEGVLTGTKQVVQSKLSLDELKMIFGM